MAGYWLNFDVPNTTGRDVNDFHLFFDTLVNPELFYTGERNPFGAGERLVLRDEETNITQSFFRWQGATVRPDQEIHLGFKSEVRKNILKAKPGTNVPAPAYWTADGQFIKKVPFPGIRLDMVGNQVTVFVKNDTSFPIVEFSNNEFALSPTPIDMNDLVWDNLTLQWTPLGPSKSVASDVEVSVGTARVSQGQYFIFRTICTDPNDTPNATRTLFQQLVPITQLPTPTRDQLTFLIAIIALILALIALLLTIL